jgi:hypothetical protein
MEDLTPEHQAAILDIINSHGHAFQAKILAVIPSFRIPSPKGNWQLQINEFPVELKGKEFHIDGIFRFVHETLYQPPEARFAIVECKRKNIEYGEWCFANSIEPGRTVITDQYCSLSESDDVPYRVAAKAIEMDAEGLMVADIGFERHFDPKKGDKKTVEKKTGNGLNDALSQVLRGVGGFAARIPQFLRKDALSRIVPLIVTTAPLYYYTGQLSEATLHSGEVSGGRVSQVHCLWYQTNVSRSLLPEVRRTPFPEPSHSLAHQTIHQNTRAVLIANTTGLAKALNLLAHQSGELLP